MNQSGRPITQPHRPPNASLRVICLCANWCHICRQLQAALADDQRLTSLVRLLWVDIEEHADLLGDLEVETFPTYLIVRDDKVLFYAPGPTQTEALMSFVMPYAMGRVGVLPASEMVQKALSAITLHFSTQ